MGCCQSSTDRGEDHAEEAIQRSSPRHAYASATLPAGNLPSIAGTSANISSPSQQSRGSPASPLSPPPPPAASTTTRPNHPIRAPSPLPLSPTSILHQPPPWTRAQLARERDAFFDTRVSGNREVWAGLRVVAETLRRIDYSHSRGATDNVNSAVASDETSSGGNDDDPLTTAQALLDALNLTCPGGRVATGRGRDRVSGGIYDERGILYELPAWIVRDPDDLILENQDRDNDTEEKGILAASSIPDSANTTTATAAAADNSNSGEAEKSAAPTPPSPQQRRRRSDFKGKGRAEDFGEMIAVRARLSDRVRDVIVRVGENQPVLAVLNAVRAQIGLDPEPPELLSSTTTGGNTAAFYGGSKNVPRVRLVYLGKLLDLRRSLAENGWNSSHVVNAFVYLPEDLKTTTPDSKKK